jgi:hypothetical protein
VERYSVVSDTESGVAADSEAPARRAPGELA